MKRKKEYEYTDDVKKHTTDMKFYVTFAVLVYYNWMEKQLVHF